MNSSNSMVMASATKVSETRGVKTCSKLPSEFITEVWKKVPGYSNYMVSSLGRVKALNYQNKGYEVVITPYQSDGHLCFWAVSDRGNRKLMHLAYAVAEAFIPNFNKVKLKYVQYKDGDTTNCTVSNLYWSCRRKVDGPFVYVYDKNGGLLKKFESAIDAADFFGCSWQNVDAHCKRYTSCKGFFVSYEYMTYEMVKKRFALEASVKTEEFFNHKTPHKTYGYKNLTYSSDPECKPFAKIVKSPKSEAGLPKVKKGPNGKVVEVALKLNGYKGKSAEVKFVLQADNSYEVEIDYPNGASIMVARCKYSFSSQSEFMVCAEALDSMYRTFVASKNENVKDVFIGEFMIGKSAK